MAKDPAFLFYSTDFFMGTIEMSDEQAGQYIRLMCLQHQKGHLTEAAMLSVMRGQLDPLIMSKFQQDEDGKYYNVRLEEEISKRHKYAKSRQKNRAGKADEEHTGNISETYAEDMSHICSSHDEHMVNENEIENVNKDRDEIRGSGGKELPGPRAKKAKGTCFPSDSHAYQAAVYLDKQMCARLPGQKPASEKQLQAWALEFDRCQRLDGHSWEDIGRVLRFSQSDSFWQANILSGGKFREKYVQLLAKMQAGPGHGREPPGQAPPRYTNRERYV